jgi:hypothetical protein
MDRKGVIAIAASILAASIIIGLSQAWAQHGFRSDSRPEGPWPRYVVVNVTEAEVIIMDAATGDLYSAKPTDVKPYATRPRPDRSFATGQPRFDKVTTTTDVFRTTTERPRLDIPKTTDRPATTEKPKFATTERTTTK